MRMWMVDPFILCRQHLLGEHVELHMFVGHLTRGNSVDGYVAKNLLESATIEKRHKALAVEMKRRGYNHRSKLVYRDTLSLGKINRKDALDELLRRCKLCRIRYAQHC